MRGAKRLARDLATVSLEDNIFPQSDESSLASSISESMLLTPPTTPARNRGGGFKDSGTVGGGGGGGGAGGGGGGGGHRKQHLHGGGGGRELTMSANMATTASFGGKPRLGGSAGGAGGAGVGSSSSSMKVNVSIPTVVVTAPLSLPLLSSIVDGGELSEYDGDDEGDGCVAAADRHSTRMDRL